MSWSTTIAETAKWVTDNVAEAEVRAGRVLAQLVDGRSRLVAIRSAIDHAPEASRPALLQRWRQLAEAYNDFAGLLGLDRVQIGALPILLLAAAIAAAAYVTSWWGEVCSLEAQAQIERAKRGLAEPSAGLGGVVAPLIGIVVVGGVAAAALSAFGSKR